MKRLEKKVAIITGGAGSIGISTAKLFIAEGAKVVLVDLAEADLKKAVAEIGTENINYCIADVSKSEDVQHYVNETVKMHDTIDITSKHAVVGIMRATAVEAAHRKIRGNTVHPSPVDNRMMRSLEDGFAEGLCN